jgi:site-specific DNA-methyltransferase (adenine-specific)
MKVLKPGGYLLAFGGTRTYHRLATAIEDAGFEIRDQLVWVYGSGFPKSRNVALDMDKMEGHANRGHRIAVASRIHPDGTFEPNGENLEAYAPKTTNGQKWAGFGTALKPSIEPVVMARKPFKGNVADNVLKHGCGAINIDRCRVATNDDLARANKTDDGMFGVGNNNNNAQKCKEAGLPYLGRWPANFIHDGSDEVLDLMPSTAPSSDKPRNNGAFKSVAKGDEKAHITTGHKDNGGSAARFFYCPKASKKDREDGNIHTTVKPTELMAYLCRLVTQPCGTILDPFMGSGSTGKAAVREGFRFIGIEKEAEYFKICQARVIGGNNGK